ncbi:MAG: hypothetical protein H7A55_07525 [Verrucomicrobiaceae bacterium]|nr:hypothetical protein [Verrucomicrobiaceae bacterium]
MKDRAAFTAYFHTLTPAQQQTIVSSVQNAVQNPKMSEVKRVAATAFLKSLK